MGDWLGHYEGWNAKISISNKILKFRDQFDITIETFCSWIVNNKRESSSIVVATANIFFKWGKKQLAK